MFQSNFGAGCARELSLALRVCTKSLKVVTLNYNEVEGDVPFAEITEALSKHPQLEQLDLRRMNIGTNECTALVNLLRSTAANLLELSLGYNTIEDVGVDVLVDALLPNSSLRSLDLSYNPITIRGCQSLAALLENPNSNLDALYLDNNNIGNLGAFIFANALARNRKLNILYLNNDITAEGWSSFSKVLCDTSSVNNTHLSNHTLENLFGAPNIPADVNALLHLNSSSEDKRQVAMTKILKHHQHFDMQPFFEWDLKVLPLVIDWFDRARSIESTDIVGTGKRKLDAIYQFIRAIPESFE